MNILFSKTLSVEPDHLVELTGPDEYLERDLVAYDFARVDSEKDNTAKERSDAADPTISKEPLIRVHLHVSLKHLTDASKYFRTAKQWKEKSEQAGEPTKWHDTYVMAFVYLLTIAHGHALSVINEWIDFTRLYQICTLIDQLELHDNAKLCTDVWFNRLKGQIPTEPSDNAKQWLFVTYVLKKQAYFTPLTVLIQRHFVPGSAQLLSAPLTAWIEARLEENRDKALSLCKDRLDDLENNYRAPCDMVCPHRWDDCDAFTMGNLILDLGNLKLWPICERRFGKFSLQDLYAKLTSIEEKRYLRHRPDQSSGRDCGLHKKILSIAAVLLNPEGIPFPVVE